MMSFTLEDKLQKAEHTLVRVKARRHIAGQAEKIKAGEKKSALLDSNADGGLITSIKASRRLSKLDI